MTTTNMASCTSPQWLLLPRQCLHKNTKYGVWNFQIGPNSSWILILCLSRESQGRWKRISSPKANLEKTFARTKIKMPHLRRSVPHSPFKLDCKTVGIFAYSSTRARKTLTPRFTDFFTDFLKKKKPTVLQSTLTKSVKYTLLLISNSLLSFGIYRSKIESISGFLGNYP